MLDAQSWVEPILEWGAPLDTAELQRRLTKEGELLATWPAAPFETTPTDCFQLGDRYWICQPGVGAVQFRTSDPRLTAYPSPEGDAVWFQEVVGRSWLPAIYPFWGRQVVHASAVAVAGTGDAVAFTGPTHAGKSTTAYGLGQRPGWRLLSDDTLAFSTGEGARDGGIRLHPLKNDARLRPASADFFGKGSQTFEPVEWPAGRLRLKAIYVLEGDDSFAHPSEFTKLRIGDGLPLLLQQAYALSFKIPKYNQQLMKDYAQLAASVPMFRLRYRRSFALADALFGALEEHIAADLGLVARNS